MKKPIPIEDINWQQMAFAFHNNYEYYVSLLDKIGKSFGKISYISDDGSIQQDIIRAKLPELVKQLIKENKKLKKEAKMSKTSIKTKYWILSITHGRYFAIDEVPILFDIATACRVVLALCTKVTQVYSHCETIVNNKTLRKGSHDLSWYRFIPNGPDSTHYWNYKSNCYDYRYHNQDSWEDNFNWLEKRVYQQYEFLIIKATSEQKQSIRARTKKIKTYHGDKSICLRTMSFAYGIAEDLGLCYDKEYSVRYSKFPRHKTIWNKQELIDRCKDIITE